MEDGVVAPHISEIAPRQVELAHAQLDELPEVPRRAGAEALPSQAKEELFEGAGSFQQADSGVHKTLRRRDRISYPNQPHSGPTLIHYIVASMISRPPGVIGSISASAFDHHPMAMASGERWGCWLGSVAWTG